MSAAAQTKIFGVKLGVDPKVIIGILVVIAAVVFWYNSRSDEGTAPATGARPEVAAQPPVQTVRGGQRSSRRGETKLANRDTLRIKQVDASDGRTDPTLRLDMLQRLQAVAPAKPGRSLFEIGPSEQVTAASVPIQGPKIPINTPAAVQQPIVTTAPARPAVNIPLRFYGFANPASKDEANRGLFLDGDNILVATEGQVLQGRYLVVELNQTSARLEDVQLRQGQTLPVVPEAMQQ